jgi:hypothetical protein
LQREEFTEKPQRSRRVAEKRFYHKRRKAKKQAPFFHLLNPWQFKILYGAAECVRCATGKPIEFK